MAQNSKALVPLSSDAVKVFNLLVETYNITDPVEQLIANRAAGQFMKLQEFERWIKDKGGGSIFYCHDDGIIHVHPAGFFIKQLEGDFRANIKLLSASKKNMKQEKPKDFSKWLEGAVEVKEDEHEK